MNKAMKQILKNQKAIMQVMLESLPAARKTISTGNEVFDTYFNPSDHEIAYQNNLRFTMADCFYATKDLLGDD